MGQLIKRVQIQGYVFPESVNPFAFDAQQKESLAEVAVAIDDAIQKIAKKNRVLIRGIQSGKHDGDREILVQKIIQEGTDGYSEEQDSHRVIFAAPYDGLRTIKFILSGFHEFKPKCEERPQYPVDIWMVFSESAFKNIEYIHPKHNTKANDKWQVLDEANIGLIGVIIIN